MVNDTFIENRHTSECNHVLCKFLVRSTNKLFEMKIFVPFLERCSKPVSESTSLRESFAINAFTKIMVSKFIKVSAFNENKYKGLNKRKNKSFCS